MAKYRCMPCLIHCSHPHPSVIGSIKFPLPTLYTQDCCEVTQFDEDGRMEDIEETISVTFGRATFDLTSCMCNAASNFRPVIMQSILA